MNEEAKNKLRDLAQRRLSLYIREMGREFYEKLVANKLNWRAGYVPAHDEFWVLPQTDDGHIIVGPFTVVKWKHLELWLQGVTGAELAALKDEARQVGFEQWAAA